MYLAIAIGSVLALFGLAAWLGRSQGHDPTRSPKAGSTDYETPRSDDSPGHHQD